MARKSPVNKQADKYSTDRLILLVDAFYQLSERQTRVDPDEKCSPSSGTDGCTGGVVLSVTARWLTSVNEHVAHERGGRV